MFNIVDAIERGRALVPNLVVELEAEDEMVMCLLFTSKANKGVIGVKYEVSWVELLNPRKCVLDKAFDRCTEAIANKYRAGEEEGLTWVMD